MVKLKLLQGRPKRCVHTQSSTPHPHDARPRSS
jgi:hypothetical protein